MQKGQCAVIYVEQRGINVALLLGGSNGDPWIEVDDEIGKQGMEKLEVVAERDRTYTVAVKPRLKVASGGYEIRLVELRPATGLDQTLYEVQQLRTKVHYLSERENPAEAFPLAERALSLSQQALGPDDVYVAIVMKDLAEITAAMRKPQEAKPRYERALQVLTAKLGVGHPQTIFVESRLGDVYVDLEDYPKAEQLFNQALENEERILGRDDPLLVGTLRGLGILHADRGDYVMSEREFLRALSILENTGLTEGRQYGQVLNGLGVLYHMQQKPATARTYLERALAFREKKYGPESLAVSDVLQNLGVICSQANDLDAAEKYYLRTMAIEEKLLGPEHPEFGGLLENLASVYTLKGQYQKALELNLRALSIAETTSGSEARLGPLRHVAENYAVLGDFENANKFMSQLQSALENAIALNLFIGSERQKLAYLSTQWTTVSTYDPISLNLQLEPNNSQATATAATVVLQRKGRVLDAMTDTFAVLRKHSAPQDQALLDQLKEATTQLAEATIQGPQKRPLEEYRHALQRLQERKEKLENTISHYNEEFRAEYQPVTTKAVLSAIPADAALVEFFAYRSVNLKAQSSAEKVGGLRYGVYVLQTNAVPHGIDLGDAKAIDVLVGELRAALPEPSRSDVRRLAQAVAEKVFQPLEAFVVDKTHLLIAPDGQLNLIPFEALLDDQGRYLIERFSITYLTTGRDLLRMQVPRPSRTAPVLIADPLFGEAKETLAASKAMSKAKPAIARTARRSITTGVDFAGLYFAPLEGTKAEARSIQALFPEAHVLTGEQATESALEQLNAPEILHIATHGFFLEDASKAKSSPVDATSDPENPLLRSGLALTGANLSRDSKGRGILTAMQASNLDLWGTKLVTLSACDTGLGDVENGEGVFGLRRAFFLAGTESLVMSLWPVSDYVTRELMTQYYSGLKNGVGRGEALRQAQLAMSRRKGREHPFYWASFIQAGEWANLDGKR
jgi:CHAT domain-containing protein/Tfp pilus assembly protein PilF